MLNMHPPMDNEHELGRTSDQSGCAPNPARSCWQEVRMNTLDSSAVARGLAACCACVALMSLSFTVAAGDECIPRSPARDKSKSYYIGGTVSRATPPPVVGQTAAATTVGKAALSVAEARFSESKALGRLGALSAAHDVNQAFDRFRKLDTDRDRLPPGTLDKAAVDVVVPAGAVATVIAPKAPGMGAGVSLSGDVAKVGIDVSYGRMPQPEDATAVIGKGAAIAAGAMIGGPVGADAGAVAFDAGVATSNAVVQVAVDRYFERRDTEIMQRADDELYERYRELLRRKGVPVDGGRDRLLLPSLR